MRRTCARAAAVAVPVAVSVLLLGACGGDDDGVADSAPSLPPPPSSSVEIPKPDLSKPLPMPCPPAGNGIPDGAVARDIVDVDFDGIADVGWLFIDNGRVELGITTASGGTFSTPVDLAGPAERVALVADVDGRGTVIALASDGRTANLYRVTACALVTATNQEGGPYQFDLGFRGNGTGIGCLDVTGDGITDLVGLNAVPAQGRVTVTRTEITMTGSQARGGARDEISAVPGDPAALTAEQITCGKATMDQDGIQVAG